MLVDVVGMLVYVGEMLVKCCKYVGVTSVWVILFFEGNTTL